MSFTTHTSSTRKCLIGNKVCEVLITIAVDDDGTPFDGDNAEDIAAWQRGDFSMMVVRVKAILGGIDGSDYLGGVCVSKGSDIDDVVDEHGMIDNAIDDLRKQIAELLETLGVKP